MTYEEKYPSASNGDQPGGRDEFDLLCGRGLGPCWHCNRPTRWLNVSFETNLCSEECTKAKWEEFDEACRRAPRAETE